MIKSAYISGFLHKCAETGLSDDDVTKLLQTMALTQGATTEEDTDENDYKSGIGDMFRSLWKPNRVMARKQRRFERDFADARGLFAKGKMKFKHPFRSLQAEGISGAAPEILAAIFLAASAAKKYGTK